MRQVLAQYFTWHKAYQISRYAPDSSRIKKISPDSFGLNLAKKNAKTAPTAQLLLIRVY